MDLDLIATAIHTVASLIHGDNLAAVKAKVAQLAAVATADLPDGSGLTEQAIIDHADQIIADAEARRAAIAADPGDGA